jgi:hypothetical protein
MGDRDKGLGIGGTEAVDDCSGRVAPEPLNHSVGSTPKMGSSPPGRTVPVHFPIHPHSSLMQTPPTQQGAFSIGIDRFPRLSRYHCKVHIR